MTVLSRSLREIALTVGAVLGVACIGLGVAAWLFGVHLLVFRSGSMSPTIQAGGAALARHVGASEVRVGDIVSVRAADGARITHRVAKIERAGSRTSLVLKGDANDAPDSAPYVVDSVDRVFWHANGLGFVAHAFASRWGVAITGAAAVGLLVLGFGSGPGGPGGDGGRRAATHRSARTTRRVRAGAIPFLALGLTGVLAGPAMAAWTDTATVTSDALASYTVPKPPMLGCTVKGGLLQPYSATVSWTAVSAPYAFGYTATVNGVPITIDASGSTRSITIDKGILTNLLGNLLGNSVTIAVHGTLSGGSGSSAWTWTSPQASTRVVNVSLLGLAWTCGASS